MRAQPEQLAGADELPDRTIKLPTDSLRTDGGLDEDHHPDTGKSPGHKGFRNWTMLALEMIRSIQAAHRSMAALVWTLTAAGNS